MCRNLLNLSNQTETKMKNFEELKEKILTAAKAERACNEEYKKAYSSENMSDLCDVIKRNFNWCCDHGVLTPELIENYKSYFSENGIYHNENVRNAYLLASGSSTVESYDSSMVEAFDNSKVISFDNSTVRAFASSNVKTFSTI